MQRSAREEAKILWRWYGRRRISHASSDDSIRLAASAIHDCQAEASDAMQPWLTVFDEAVSCVHHLHSLLENRHLDVGASAACSMATARLLNLLISIRLLAVSGLDRSARVLARTTLEVSDYVLASFDDDQFARESFDPFGDPKFWDKHIGYGKLARRVDTLVERLDQRNRPWREIRKTHKDELSESVHVSVRSTIFTGLTPSLTATELFAVTPFSHLSLASPFLLDMLAKEIYLLTSVILARLDVAPLPKLMLGTRPDRQVYWGFGVAALVLQDLVLKYWNHIEALIPRDEEADFDVV